jgi:hypothetical protein
MVSEKVQMENRVKAVAIIVDDCVKWYIANNSGVGPEEIREQNYGDEYVMRWLEPALPGLDNPVIVEGYFRGFYTIRIENRATFKPGDL